MNEDKPISFGRRVTMLATEHPDKTAIVFVRQDGEERTVPWQELDRRSTQVAHLLAARGIDRGSMVINGLPNCIEHFFVTIGAWKLGALILPLNAAMPVRERNALLDLAQPKVVVADWTDAPFQVVTPEEIRQSTALSDQALPDVLPHPAKAIGSGGSTGRPKIIVDPDPWAFVPGRVAVELGQSVGLGVKQTQLVAGALYHNAPFSWSYWGLFEDHLLILMEHFDATSAVDLIERYRVNFMFMVPTMMQRMIRLPDIRQRDFSSAQSFWHSAAACPPWLKREWIDLLGGERLREAFGATENIGHTAIRGDEWLQHPGSVGKPQDAELKILDEEGRELPPGQVGEIYLRPHKATGPTYRYIGAPPAKTTPDGFISVGDMGWVDADGYVFLADRRIDMIISGGANIYPAEVEAALTEHAQVADVAVIGIPDDEWGKRVHAVIQPRDPMCPPSVRELDRHCRERLAAYKVPKSYEFVGELPRQPSGKILRSAMVAERQQAPWPNMISVRE